MKAKTTSDSFSDNFSDNNYTANPAWTVTGTWSAASGAMANSSAVGTSTAYRAVTSGDLQVKASLRKTSSGGTANFFIRDGVSADSVYVETADGTVRIKQIVGGVTTTLDTVNLTTTLNTWYDYHIIADGKRVEVWRGPQGGMTELILETDACTVPASTRFTLHAWTCTAGFDNIEFITNDPATQTMAYNGANELTSSVVGAITTTYTYDEWGRTISKADGTHSATYYWRFGDKLKQYDTTFPGESGVAFQYDGLGKRRLKLQLPSGGYTDADFTWYRWDAGWNMIGEYAAGGNTGTEWDVGALGRWYQGKVAHADGEPDIAAHNYYSHDQLGTPRSIYSQSKVVVARQETSPYGVPIRIAGLAMDVGFTGHKWDSEIKGYYAAYRYYHPTEARWISRDPLGMVDGPNTYVYVNCGPISSKDDLGLFGGPISPPGTNPWGPGGPYQNAANASDCESCAEAARRLREAGYNEYPFEPTDSNNFMRHCTTSCQLAREKGKACAFAAGWAGEFRGHFSWDDARINSIGRRVSDSALSCKAGCKAARNGML